MTKLTQNFTLEELVNSQTAARHNIKNAPGEKQIENLHRLAETLEKVRTILDDKPILISSGYRALKINTMVGGSVNSAHVHGLAADFICPGFGAPLAVCQELEPHMEELGIDQLIYEFGTWVHLGLSAGSPRTAALTIDKHGTCSGFRER